MKLLRYIELKSGHSDNGPAWIAYVEQSKTRRTLYFNGRGLMKLKGQRRGAGGGNYVDMETGDSFWVSGVKKNGEDRHWAGSGKVLVEAAAVSEYLKTIKAGELDTSRCEVTNSIQQTDIKRLSRLPTHPFEAPERFRFVCHLPPLPGKRSPDNWLVVPRMSALDKLKLGILASSPNLAFPYAIKIDGGAW